MEKFRDLVFIRVVLNFSTTMDLQSRNNPQLLINNSSCYYKRFL
ncbi:hypothetical protein HMPREF2532_02123 [Bacteroides ovatus]|nr:hypothetical protein HMPREF2532_02123 [Bacteroides ovatus]